VSNNLSEQKSEMFVTSGAVLDVVKLKRCFMGVTNVLEHINGYMCHRTRLGN